MSSHRHMCPTQNRSEKRVTVAGMAIAPQKHCPLSMSLSCILTVTDQESSRSNPKPFFQIPQKATPLALGCDGRGNY